MNGELRYSLEGTTIRVGMIPETPNTELRHLGQVANRLRHAIPFKFEVVIEPSVFTIQDPSQKRTLPGVEICIRPKAIDLSNAIGQLKAKQFNQVSAHAHA